MTKIIELMGLKSTIPTGPVLCSMHTLTLPVSPDLVNSFLRSTPASSRRLCMLGTAAGFHFSRSMFVANVANRRSASQPLLDGYIRGQILILLLRWSVSASDSQSVNLDRERSRSKLVA